MNGLNSLNPEQLRAVQHAEGPLLVLAGAGSGKTRVITHRIAYALRERGVPASSILAVTFTNRAAAEMRRRVEALVGFSAHELWVSTFHAAGARILRDHAELLGRTRNFSIYDAEDQGKVLSRCLKDCGYDSSDLPLARVKASLEESKNRLNDGRGVGWSPRSQEIEEVFRRYEEYLLQNNAFDFGDLIVGVIHLFQQNPDVLQEYQNRFRYILVDEFQDTNPAQYRLLQLLADSHHNLCVVGDDDQSIYRWRGADVSNILRFETDFEGAEVIRLEQNYRSTRNILGAANALIAKNTARKGKNLWTEEGAGERVEILCLREDRSEARYVAERIARLCSEEGVRYRDIAIFYRTNAQSRLFEEELRRRRVPYTLFGGVEFYQRAEIKDMMAYLSWIVNPSDSLSLRRIINVPPRGLGKASLAALERIAVDRGISLHDAVEFALQGSILPKRIRSSLEDFVAMAREWRDHAREAVPSELVERVLAGTGYLQMLQETEMEETIARVENLQEFIHAVQEFEEENPSASIAQFLQQLALTTSQDRVVEEDSVALMTLHIAKGLEFDVVFMVGMEEGLFPHAHSLSDWEELEEERRLCYVGMTRAKRKLTLTHCWKRRLYGEERLARGSRFLREIPEEFSRRDGFRSEWVFETGTSFADMPEQEEGSPYRVGMKVQHAEYGVGIVRGVEGRDEKLKVSIFFPHAGIRKFLVRQAPLGQV